MIVWRLCKKKHASTALNGEGARLYGGRWNHKGTRVAYCSATLSLAILEMLVHVDPGDLPTDLQAIEIEIPDDVSRTQIGSSALPIGWRVTPGPDTLKDLGTNWLIVATAAVLIVPSVVVPFELNYLVNPAHLEAARIKVRPPSPFSLDPRLFASAGAP